MFIKLAMLFLFLAATVIVGVLCRKHSTDVSGFVLGGRSVGPWLTAFAYGTSYFSAVIFIGYAGQFGWRFGIASTWIGIGNALLGSLIAWVVLGRRTRLMTHYYKSSTMPDFFGKRYISPSLKILSAVIVFIFLIPYTASLYNGLSRLFQVAFFKDAADAELVYIICIAVMSVLTCVYVIIGGYMATAVNDFIQGIIMLIGIAAVVLAVLNTNGGFTASLAALAQVEDSAVSEVPGIFASFFGADPASLLGVIILTSLGTWGLPQMVGKFYAIKDERSIRSGTVVSTVFAVIVAGGCYFLGGFGRLFSTTEAVSANGYDSIIPTMLKNLPDWLMGIVLILVLSASMSTLSSLVLTSSSTLTLDLIKGTVVKKMKDKHTMPTMRVLIVFFVALSAFIAIIQFKSHSTFIAQLMGLSWGALAGAFLAPFLYGLFWKRTTKAACFVCFVFAPVVMLLNTFVPSIFPAFLKSPINCGAFVMIAGLVIVPIISLLTKAPDKSVVNDSFECFERPVVAKTKKYLE